MGSMRATVSTGSRFFFAAKHEAAQVLLFGHWAVEEREPYVEARRGRQGVEGGHRLLEQGLDLGALPAPVLQHTLVVGRLRGGDGRVGPFEQGGAQVFGEAHPPSAVSMR